MVIIIYDQVQTLPLSTAMDIIYTTHVIMWNVGISIHLHAVLWLQFIQKKFRMKIADKHQKHSLWEAIQYWEPRDTGE